ncbi:MAG TPA: hypothetical protein PLM75_00005, partial [bacterium]|nr:hypothetical protein [bacterium]
MEKLNKYIKKFFWFVNCATVVQALCLAYLFLIIIIYFILVADFFQPQQTAKFLQNHNSIILSLLYIFFIGLILKLTTFYNYQSVIKLIEKKFGNFNYKLSSVFTAYNDKINNQFVEYLTDELIADFKSLKYSDYRKSTNNILKSSIIICGIAIILQALLFYIFRPRIIIFFKNYFQPKNYITATIFKITPQNIIVLKGESIKIQIQIAGADQDKTPDMIIVNNNNYASKKINLKNFEVSKNKYEYTFSNVLENFEFYIQTQFSKSDRYYVKTYNSPHLEIEQISTQPPKYTGLPIDYYYSAPEKLNVYKGSKIQLKCVVNFDNSNLKILFNSKQFSPKKENNRIFDFEWTVNQSGIVRFNFKSPLADAIENFKSLKIDISADNYPSVRFSYPNKPELQLSEDMLIPFNIYAEDDFGISAGELYINAPSKQDIIKLEFKNIGNYYEAFYTVDFSKYNLLPGDEIFYFAKVYDNDEISGFKSAQSEKYKILMPTMLDIFNNLNKELETTTNVFDALKKKNTELLKSTQKIIDDLVRKGATDWATQKQIKELIDQQRKIADEISQLQENVKNAIANYQQAKEKLGADTLEKIQKLTALMNELANSEIGKELFKLEKALNAATQKERLENLNAALFDKEQFTNKLEKTISLLNQLKFQNLLNNLQKSITDILKKQSQISENLQENNFNNAAHNQNLTTKELSKMQNTLTELANSEQSTNINDTIKQLEESLKKLTEKSEKFAELLKEFNTNNKRNISPDDLQKESQNLTRQLSSLANQINSMLSMYANLEYQKFQKELDEIILKMINLQKSNTEFSRLINDYIKILENPYLDFNEDNDISKHIGFIENLQNYVYFQSLKYFNL